MTARGPLTIVAGAVLVAGVLVPASAGATVYERGQDGEWHVREALTPEQRERRERLLGDSEWIARGRAMYGPLIAAAAAAYDLDPELLHVVVEAESGYRADAVSSAGAIGLMQILPETGAIYGVTDLFDPTVNLDTGARHLRRLLDEFRGDLRFALAAYHAGSGSVRPRRAMPAYEDTRAYVRRVITTLEARQAANDG